MGKRDVERPASLVGYAGSFRASGWCTSSRAIKPVHSAQPPGIVNGFLPPTSEGGASPNCRWIAGLAESGTGVPPVDLQTWARCPCHSGQPTIGRCAPLKEQDANHEKNARQPP